MVETLVLLAVSLFPVVVLIWFVRRMDKYEKEPMRLVIKSLWAGVLSVIPTLILGLFVAAPLGEALGIVAGSFESTVWDSFITAGLIEEAMKMLAFYWAVWKNPNFNEPYDGIVYATAASLGFAGLENILYVFEHGLGTGIARAFLAVPGHTFFAVAMGYFMGKVKFGAPERKAFNGFMALAVPVALHGLYDVMAFNVGDSAWFGLGLLVVVVFMWVYGIRKMKAAQGYSPFKEQQVPASVEPEETTQVGQGPRACEGCGFGFVQTAKFCPQCGRPVQQAAPGT